MGRKRIMDQTITVSAPISEEQHEWLRQLAFENRCSISEMLRRLLSIVQHELFED